MAPMARVFSRQSAAVVKLYVLVHCFGIKHLAIMSAMEKEIGLSIVLFALLAPSLAPGAAPALSQSPGNGTAPSAMVVAPHIQFASPVYDFGKVDAGQAVKHDFVFTNAGNATLEITDVRTSCGCATMGKWDRQVGAGKTGAIPIELNTAGYRGGVVKTVNVLCNDPAQTNVVLQFKGTIWTPVDVLPSLAYFAVSSELPTNETKTLRIINNMEGPLAITEVVCTNRALKAELKTVRQDKEFQLQLTTAPPFHSNLLHIPVILKTASKRVPSVTVNAYLIAQPTVVATPSEIILPAGPLAADVKSSVMIRNSGTNAVSLSAPGLNTTNATVQLQELKPGRLFSLLATFPAGFQIQPGQAVELSVQTTHPSYPVIKVPVRQPPRGSLASPSLSPSPTVLNPVAPTLPRPITVTPPAVLFSVYKESPAGETKTVRIVNNETNLLTIASPVCTNGALKADLQTVQSGREFELRVAAVPPFSTSSVRTMVLLNTSSPQMPVITIPAAIMVQPTVQVTPAQITVPVSATASGAQSSVVIRNNGTNALVLSDPSLNITNVTVQLKELQAGRLFTATVSFPAQFQSAATEGAQLRIRSNHPDYPMIQVPIVPALSARVLPAMLPGPSMERSALGK